MKVGVITALVVTSLLLSACEKKEGKEATAPAPVEEKAKEVKTPEGPSQGGAFKLANDKGCLSCHDIKVKKVGPAYLEVAKKYSGKKGAVEELVRSITKGSMGKWGSIPMTPQPVTQDQARELAEWILSLK